MSHGRLLKLFLADGTDSGPKSYEIVNRTIQALEIPATKVKELKSKADYQRPGVYLIVGEDEEGTPRLYLGKSEKNVANRVQDHCSKLESEITRLLLFSNKGDNLNASQVGWLETKLIKAAQLRRPRDLVNKQTPDSPSLSSADLATVEEFFADVKLIAQTAGYIFFDPPKRASSGKGTGDDNATENEEARFKFRDAEGYPSDEGFVVLKGSHAAAEPQPSLSDGYKRLREDLIDQGVLMKAEMPDNDKLTFTRDYAFRSSSAAAAVIAGWNISGPNKAWKNPNDETIEQYRSRLAPEESD